MQVYMSPNTSWKPIMGGDHVLLLNSSYNSFKISHNQRAVEYLPHIYPPTTLQQIQTRLIFRSLIP